MLLLRGQKAEKRKAEAKANPDAKKAPKRKSKGKAVKEEQEETKPDADTINFGDLETYDDDALDSDENING